MNNSNYIEFIEDLVDKKTLPFKHFLFKLHIGEETEFEQPSKPLIRLPESSYNQLLHLLKYFNLTSLESEFLSFLLYTQENFINYGEGIGEDLYLDNLSDRKDMESLFQVLELFISGNRKELDSILFKFRTDETRTIKNFFIVKHVYSSMLDYFDLNKENFQAKKEEVIKKFTNDFNFKKGREYIKTRTIQVLFEFLKSKIDISDNQALKFCGVFLHICQIPSNNKNDDITIDEIENSLGLIDHTNIMHYKNARQKFFLK